MRSMTDLHVDPEEEEESAFVTMTDMTVSILFILLILLGFFASQLRPEPSEPALLLAEKDDRIAVLADENARLTSALNDLASGEGDIASLATDLAAARARLQARDAQLETTLLESARLTLEIEDLATRLEAVEVVPVDRLQSYNTDVEEVRRRLLVDLRNRIDADLPELQVRISASGDALQFTGEGLFAPNSAGLSQTSMIKVRRIAEIVDAALPCVTTGSRARVLKRCNEGGALVEALQIEGHTDSDGSRRTNVNLGARRAAATYGAMIEHRPGLVDYQNLEEQPVLSVAGYGEDRPVAGNDTSPGKALNRQIDLQFIMTRPARVDDIARIARALGETTTP